MDDLIGKLSPEELAAMAAEDARLWHDAVLSGQLPRSEGRTIGKAAGRLRAQHGSYVALLDETTAARRAAEVCAPLAATTRIASAVAHLGREGWDYLSVVASMVEGLLMEPVALAEGSTASSSSLDAIRAVVVALSKVAELRSTELVQLTEALQQQAIDTSKIALDRAEVVRGKLGMDPIPSAWRKILESVSTGALHDAFGSDDAAFNGEAEEIEQAIGELRGAIEALGKLSADSDVAGDQLSARAQGP